MLIRNIRLYAPLDDGTEVETSGAAPDEGLSAPESTDSAVNWDDMESDFVRDESDVEGEFEVVREEPQAKPVEVAGVPVAPPAPASAPTEAPASVPPSEVPPTPAPAPSPEAYTSWRAQRLTELEQQYALDEASSVAALTEPEKVLPQLAARVHLEVLESSMRAMQAMLPTVLGRIQQGTELNSRAKNLFTSVNPDLAEPQYEGAILQFGQVYRSMNKTAPPEEAARAIGSLVRAAYGIVQAPAPAAPVPGPGMRPTATFTPARGSGSAMRPMASDNPFTQMASEMENEDW